MLTITQVNFSEIFFYIMQWVFTLYECMILYLLFINPKMGTISCLVVILYFHSLNPHIVSFVLLVGLQKSFTPTPGASVSVYLLLHRRRMQYVNL